MRKHRNEAMYQAMVELRRSSAADLHRNKVKYNRKVKHRNHAFDSD